MINDLKGKNQKLIQLLTNYKEKQKELQNEIIELQTQLKVLFIYLIIYIYINRILKIHNKNSKNQIKYVNQNVMKSVEKII